MRLETLAIFVALFRLFSAQPESVPCEDPYALCAFANCTVNTDRMTANCLCYSFPDPALSYARVNLIPKTDVKLETIDACEATNCTEVDSAPVCTAIANGTLWPDAELVSTYSSAYENRNNVTVLENGTYVPTWTCSAAPGRSVPVCMLAPCVYSRVFTNPYFEGAANSICTCPLVEVKVDYNVYGGLQNPCSSKTTEPGDYVQAAGDAILTEFESDPAQVQAAWAAVGDAFEALVEATAPAPAPTSTAPARNRVWLLVRWLGVVL